MKEKINKITISFLIVTITLFGALSFIFNKETIDNILNYYIIFASGLTILILFFNNLKDFKIKNINKTSLILTVITLLWICLGSIFAIRINIELLKGLVNLGCLLVLGFVISNISLTDKDKKFILNSVYGSFFVCMVLGIYQYFSGINLIQYSNELYPGILGRINSTFFIATILDKYIVLITVLLMYSMIKHPKNWLYKFLFALGGVGISLTFSRGGLLVFAFISFLIFIISLFKKQFTNVLAVIVTAIGMLLIPGTSLSIQSGLDFVYDTLSLPTILRVDITGFNEVFKPTTDIVDPTDPNGSSHHKPSDPTTEPVDPPENKSVEFREYYKSIGKQLIKDYPIFGIGAGNYSYLYNNQNFSIYMSNREALEPLWYYGYPHSGYIQTAAEIGIVGLVLIILTILSYIICANKKDKLLIFTSIILLVSLLLASYTEGVFNSKQYIYVFIVIFSFICARNKTKEDDTTDSLFAKVYNKNKNSFLKTLEKNLEENKKTFVVTANPEAFMLAQKEESYKNLLLSKNTIIVPDGIGLIKAGKILGYKYSERIPGIDIAEKLLEYADKQKKKVFLFGSSQEVIDKMEALMKEKYPNAILAGKENGYVEDKDKVFKEIDKKSPDVILVALGMPLQEELIYNNLDNFKKGIFVGVGGSFDVLSGSKKRAPQIFQKLNLEWLYRILKEPKRLKRFFSNNVKYLLNILNKWFSKSWIKLAVVTMLLFGVLSGITVTMQRSNMKNKTNKTDVTILMYHGVRDDAWGYEAMFLNVNDFKDHMNYLKENGYTPIFLSEIEEANKYEKPIVITFDDGYVDVYENAYPILSELGFKFNFFIIPKFVDEGAYVTKDQIVKMSKSGIVEIGSHSYNHYDLTALEDNILNDELLKSKEYLEDIINKEVTTLAYPSGGYDSRVIEYAKKHYDYAVLAGGSSKYPSSNYTLTRLGVSRGVTKEEFIKKLNKYEAL